MESGIQGTLRLCVYISYAELFLLTLLYIYTVYCTVYMYIADIAYRNLFLDSVNHLFTDAHPL